MWGEGFLSPGGADEVARIVADTPVTGARVLDIGCGIGGVDVVLVEALGAGHVTAIDVEPSLVEHARRRVRARGLERRIDLLVVEPGPLPFPDASFDIVFSKDSLIHVPDKAMIYGEMHRVLHSGGRIAIGDWLGDSGPPSDIMREWLSIVGLTFTLDTLERIVHVVEDAGFHVVDAVDRNTWYAQEMKRELASVEGENFPRLVEALGEDAARQRVASSRIKFDVVRRGELRPAHIRAIKRT
jgi:phosphoethanolamine N-methyltransferase